MFLTHFELKQFAFGKQATCTNAMEEVNIDVNNKFLKHPI